MPEIRASVVGRETWRGGWHDSGGGKPAAQRAVSGEAGDRLAENSGSPNSWWSPRGPARPKALVSESRRRLCGTPPHCTWRPVRKWPPASEQEEGHVDLGVRALGVLGADQDHGVVEDAAAERLVACSLPASMASCSLNQVWI